MFKKLSKFGDSIASCAFGKFLVIRFGRVTNGRSESLFVHPQPDLERVMRDEFLINACRGKRVLHFGFLDSPITVDKILEGELLHTRISRVASSIYGIDVNEAGLAEYRKLTGDTENTVSDFLQQDCSLSCLSGRFDLILLPEVLEHLLNPGVALTRLKEILSLNPGSSLVVSVPNAFSLPHFVSACNNVEMVHAEHYFYFSPVTMRKLLIDCGFRQVDIILYSHTNEDMGAPGITEHGIIAKCLA